VAEQTVRIGRRIAEARDAADLTQAELAAKIPGKADGTQVSKWERGVHRPGDDTLEQIARALGKDVAWFLVAQEKPKPATPDLMGQLSADEASAAEQLAEVNGRLNRLQAVLEELAGEKVVAAALEALARAEQPDVARRPRRAA
jgi:transcriptional regulator with XRE-family HTH domain